MIIAPIPIIVAGISIISFTTLIALIPLWPGSIPHRADLLLRGITPCLLLLRRRAAP